MHASPPSTTYRLRKYIRRHRGLFAAAALIVLALLAGTGVSAWQAIRAHEVLLEANRCRKQAEKALWHLQRTRSLAMSGAGSMLHLMKDYEQAGEQFERALKLDPENALAKK